MTGLDSHAILAAMVKHKIVQYCERGNERCDCTVRAVAAAFKLSYTEAHEKLAALGRKPNRGFEFRIGIIQNLGNIECRPDLCCVSVGKIWPALQSGRFIVKITDHVYAVIDGEAHDLMEPNPRQRVEMIYEVTL